MTKKPQKSPKITQKISKIGKREKNHRKTHKIFSKEPKMTKKISENHQNQILNLQITKHHKKTNNKRNKKHPKNQIPILPITKIHQINPQNLQKISKSTKN